MPHRRLRAGQVVRRRPRGQGRRSIVADPGPAWMPSRLGAGGLRWSGPVSGSRSWVPSVEGPTSTCGGACGTATSAGTGRGHRCEGGRDPVGRAAGGAAGLTRSPAGAGCTSGPPGKPSGAAGVSAATPRPAMFRPPLNQPCRTEASYHGLGVRLFAGHMGWVGGELRLAGGFASKGGSPSGPGHDSGGWRRRLRGHAASMDPTLFVGALVQVRQSRDGTLVRMHG